MNIVVLVIDILPASLRIHFHYDLPVHHRSILNSLHNIHDAYTLGPNLQTELSSCEELLKTIIAKALMFEVLVHIL
jgi:hypothetical protein